MDKVTYFDVEYANSKNKPICQIGIINKVCNLQEPLFELNIYVNPEDGFDARCINVHQETNRDVPYLSHKKKGCDIQIVKKVTFFQL